MSRRASRSTVSTVAIHGKTQKRRDRENSGANQDRAAYARALTYARTGQQLAAQAALGPDVIRAAIDAEAEQITADEMGAICDELEPQFCGFVMHRGSRNPDSPAFGPDETCGEEAAPGSDRCPRHDMDPLDFG